MTTYEMRRASKKFISMTPRVVLLASLARTTKLCLQDNPYVVMELWMFAKSRKLYRKVCVYGICGWIMRFAKPKYILHEAEASAGTTARFLFINHLNEYFTSLYGWDKCLWCSRCIYLFSKQSVCLWCSRKQP